MKLLLHRVLPLLCAIALCSALSWVSYYAYWFGVWTFHNVTAARACAELGEFMLTPGRWALRLVLMPFGGAESELFFDPRLYAETNGLIWGVASCEMMRRFRAARPPEIPTAPAPQPREHSHAG